MLKKVVVLCKGKNGKKLEKLFTDILGESEKGFIFHVTDYGVELYVEETMIISLIQHLPTYKLNVISQSSHSEGWIIGVSYSGLSKNESINDDRARRMFG